MEKPTEKALSLFDAAFPSDERVQRKQMFGMPAAFVGEHMFYGVFANGIVIRVGESRRDELAAHAGVEAFEPMPGRPWKEYIHVDASQWSATDDLAAIIAEALEFGAKLPPKVKKDKKRGA